MSNDNNLPVINVSVTVNDNSGVFSATFTPDPVAVAGVASLLQYSLDTPDWEFGPVTFSAPFSDLETISPTQFNITDNGDDQGQFSFSVKLVQTVPHRGMPQVEIDTDPEVVNGPHP